MLAEMEALHALPTKSKRGYPMKSKPFSIFARTVLSVAALPAVLCSGMLLSQPAVANDVQIAPSNCVAPYLGQAFPMRWNENYLMNPITNTSTWVICPVLFDVDVLPAAFNAAVIGGRMTGAGPELPTCFFTVNSAVNLAQSPFIFGPAAKYAKNMPTQLNAADTRIWQSGVGIESTQILAAAGAPVGWAMSLFCKLPPGFGISQLRISN